MSDDEHPLPPLSMYGDSQGFKRVCLFVLVLILTIVSLGVLTLIPSGCIRPQYHFHIAAKHSHFYDDDEKREDAVRDTKKSEADKIVEGLGVGGR